MTNKERIRLLAKEQMLQDEDLRALLLHETGVDLDLVVELIVLENIEQRPAAARFEARGADDDPVDPGLDKGPGAHLAGLKGDVQRTALQPPVADLSVGLAYGRDLRVGQRGVVRIPPVISAADDPAVRDNDGADGDLADEECLFGLLQRGFHILDIIPGKFHTLICQTESGYKG